MTKRHLKIFNSEAERDAALQAGTLDVNSVSIWGEDAGPQNNGNIEFGVGNGPHQIKLGVNDVSNDYDDSEDEKLIWTHGEWTSLTDVEIENLMPESSWDDEEDQ